MKDLRHISGFIHKQHRTVFHGCKHPSQNLAQKIAPKVPFWYPLPSPLEKAKFMNDFIAKLIKQFWTDSNLRLSNRIELEK